MIFSLTDKYRQRVSELSEKFKYYFPLFDYNKVTECAFEIKRKSIVVTYKTLTEAGEYVSILKKIKKCMLYSDGCLIIFKDKKFVFLPATDQKESDTSLILICEFLYKKLGDFKFDVEERLWITDPLGQEGEKYHKGFSMFDSPKAIIVVSILALLMGIAFIWQRTLYNPVEKTECIKYSGSFAEYYDDDSVDIIFSNDDLYTVEASCARGDFYDKIEKLEKGQVLQLLIHPDNESIVEIRSGGIEILNFYKSQEYMRKESNLFVVIGAVIFVLGIGLLIRGCIEYKREKKQRQEQNKEASYIA